MRSTTANVGHGSCVSHESYGRIYLPSYRALQQGHACSNTASTLTCVHSAFRKVVGVFAYSKSRPWSSGWTVRASKRQYCAKPKQEEPGNKRTTLEQGIQSPSSAAAATCKAFAWHGRLTIRYVALQILAAAGIASRRAAEELIVAGRVLVNDKTEVLPQTKVVLGKDKVGARGCCRLFLKESSIISFCQVS